MNPEHVGASLLLFDATVPTFMSPPRCLYINKTNDKQCLILKYVCARHSLSILPIFTHSIRNNTKR